MPNLQVSTSFAGATILVAAPSSRQFIRVLGLDLRAASAQTRIALTDESDTIWETQATFVSPFKVALNVDSQRTFDCKPGQSLQLFLFDAVLVTGNIEYVIYGSP